jgi:hypothetical protein
MSSEPLFVHYLTLDVFTDTRFGGNPLAVILDARELTDEQMLAVTREFNYSESTFVQRVGYESLRRAAKYRLRDIPPSARRSRLFTVVMCRRPAIRRRSCLARTLVRCR